MGGRGEFHQRRPCLPQNLTRWLSYHKCENGRDGGGLRREEKLEGKGACVSKEREGKGGKGGKRGKVVDWRACKALCSPERSIFGELLLASRLEEQQQEGLGQMGDMHAENCLKIFGQLKYDAGLISALCRQPSLAPWA